VESQKIHESFNAKLFRGRQTKALFKQVKNLTIIKIKEVHVVHLKNKFYLLIIILFISACGGGGGGGGGDSIISKSDPITMAKTELSMEALADEGKSYYTNVRVDLSSDIKSKLSNGKSLYFVLSQTNDISRLNAEVFSTYGNLVITTHVLPIGSYSSTITVRGCYDANCNDEFGKATLKLNFIVHEKLNYPDEFFQLTNKIDLVNVPTELKIELKTLNLLDSQWEYQITYEDKAVDWLTAEKRTENNQAIISLMGAELTCGLYKARVYIKYTTASGLSSDISIPIEYTVSSTTPIAYSVYPRIHDANKSIKFTLKGCGIENLTLENANLASLTVSAIQQRSDSEVEFLVDGFNKQSEVNVTFSGQAVESENTKLQIRDVTQYAQQEIDLLVNESAEFKRSMYDESNNRLYFNNIDGWHAYYWENNQWQAAPNFDSDGVNDIETSNDGKQVYFLKDQSLETRDALLYTLIDDMPLEQENYGFFNSVRTLNSSELLLGQYSESNLGRLMRFDITNNNLYELPVHIAGQLGSSIITTSADRGFALLPVKSRSSSNTSYHLFDKANETIERVMHSWENVDLYRFSMSQNATRLLSIMPFRVYVNDLTARRGGGIPTSIKVGTSSANAFFKDAVISKDGNSVFALYMKATNNKLHIRIFDISGLAEGESAVMTDKSIDYLGYTGQYPQLQLNHSENTAFIFDRKLVVLPLNNE